MSAESSIPPHPRDRKGLLCCNRGLAGQTPDERSESEPASVYKTWSSWLSRPDLARLNKKKESMSTATTICIVRLIELELEKH